MFASEPNEILAIDFILLEPSWAGFVNVLARVFSKLAISYSYMGSTGLYGGSRPLV